MKQTILLTGASGAVGFEAFQELLNRSGEYVVRVFNLDAKFERKKFKPYQDLAEFVWGDIRNPEDVRRAVDGVDTVLHVAGIIPPLADEQPELARSVNIDGTKNIVAAIQQQKSPPKMIFTSSISVYGDRIDNPNITVDDPLQPSVGDEYARTKIEAEAIIHESGIRSSIFRLCGILVNQLKVQPLMFHMPLETTLEWCHVSDTGYALVQAIEKDSILGRIFNLGGGERCTTSARDFLHKMLPLWGLDLNILPEYAFATRNFHSGFYTDGDLLNDILHFRRKTLQDYLDAARERVSPLQKFLVRSIPTPIVRDWLLKMSEPLKAIKDGNENLIARFYGSRHNFEQLRSQKTR
jgi:nucleoside-diphosphate-sugar epimerase